MSFTWWISYWLVLKSSDLLLILARTVSAIFHGVFAGFVKGVELCPFQLLFYLTAQNC